MPFKSEAQRKYLWANEPEIARDWTDTYGSGIQKAKGGRIGLFRGAEADARSGKAAMSPGTSVTGGMRDRGGWDPGAGGAQHIPTPRPAPKVEPQRDVWNIKRSYDKGPWMGGPFSTYGQYGMPDLNKLYNLKRRDALLREEQEKTPIYNEFDRIPVDKYKGLEIARNYIPGDLPLDVGPYKKHSGSASTLPEYKEIGLTDKQKELLDQRKGMLGALGDQGILDTITSEDDPNDPATLEDVK